MKYLLMTLFCVLSIKGYAHNQVLKKSIIEVRTNILQKHINYKIINQAIAIDTATLVKANKKALTITRIILAGAGLGLIVAASTIPGISIILVSVIDGMGVGLLASAIFTGDYTRAEWQKNKQEQKRKRQLKKLAKESKASSR